MSELETPQHGVRRGFIEPQHDVARLDQIALGHEDFTDNAAFEMLDDLVLPRSDELSDGDDRARKRRENCPKGENSEG